MRRKTSIKAGTINPLACNGSWPVGACQGDSGGPLV
jgi:secreted trypsin-like serine protease